MSGTTLGLPAASPVRDLGAGRRECGGQEEASDNLRSRQAPAIPGPQCPYLTVEETVEYRHKEALEWTEKVGQGTGTGVAPPSLRATPFVSTASCPSGPLPGRIPTQGREVRGGQPEPE